MLMGALDNRFFDPSTPFMRIVDDGEKWKKEEKQKKEKNGENSSPLISLPVDRLNSGASNANAFAKSESNGQLTTLPVNCLNSDRLQRRQSYYYWDIVPNFLNFLIWCLPLLPVY